MILITTSDYLPKLGGLTSFVLNIERILKEENIQYEIFHWNSTNEILRYDKKLLDHYDYIINIHPMFSWFVQGYEFKMINFIHGSEVLMNSPNLIKALLKKIRKKRYFEQMEKCLHNLFISEYTQKKASELGFNVNYSRDIVFHNCIDTRDASFRSRTLNLKHLKFSCIARNVPHKNIMGTIKLLEDIAVRKKIQVSLFLPSGNNFKSDLIELNELRDNSNECRDEVYRDVNYNLLFSLDHSDIGFVEGFGLTVLEAGRFGTPSIVFPTGGLVEAVHHLKTGIVLSGKDVCTDDEILQILDADLYQSISREVYQHTLSSHSLEMYKKLFNTLMSIDRKVA